MNKSDVYTTGQVAQICNVAPRTVTKWFDTGQIKGYRIPGSRDRRIPAHELLRFLKCNNMPMPGLELGTIRVLLADSNRQWLEKVCNSLNQRVNYNAQWADNTFEIGYMSHKIRPHVIIINIMSKDFQALEISRLIHANPDLGGTKVIAITPELKQTEKNALMQKGFDDVLAGNVEIDSIIHAIADATSMIF